MELDYTQQLVMAKTVTQIKIQFRSCITGEILLKTINGFVYCLPCPDSKYFLFTPEENNFDQTCLPCPASMAVHCEGSRIDLKNEYWRSGIDSDTIVYCQNAPENCIAQESVYPQYCLTGHIGPLCEECDTFGTHWGKRYSSNGDF